jgi:hypothetical protein
MHRRSTSWLLGLLWLACGGDETATPQKPSPHDPTLTPVGEASTGGAVDSTGGSTTSDGGGAGTAGGDACDADHPCAEGFCSAPNVPAQTPTAGEYRCGACVENDAPATWCLDATSCCSAGASCEFGLCREAVASDGPASGSGDTGSGSGSSSGTGGA